MEIPHELYLQAIKCGSEAARIMTGRPAQKDRLGSWFKKTELTGGRSAGVCLLRYTPPLHNPPRVSAATPGRGGGQGGYHTVYHIHFHALHCSRFAIDSLHRICYA